MHKPSRNGDDNSPLSGGWFKVGNAVVDDLAASIGPYGLAVLVVIMRHRNAYGRSWPSLSRIAELTGISRRKVQGTVKALVDAGAVKLEKRGDDHNPNVYLVGHGVPHTVGHAVRGSGARGARLVGHGVPNGRARRASEADLGKEDLFEQDPTTTDAVVVARKEIAKDLLARVPSLPPELANVLTEAYAPEDHRVLVAKFDTVKARDKMQTLRSLYAAPWNWGIAFDEKTGRLKPPTADGRSPKRKPTIEERARSEVIAALDGKPAPPELVSLIHKQRAGQMTILEVIAAWTEVSLGK